MQLAGWVLLFARCSLIFFSFSYGDQKEPLEPMIATGMFGNYVIQLGRKAKNKPMIVIKVKQTQPDGSIIIVDKPIKVISVQKKLVQYLLAITMAQCKESIEILLITVPGI